MHEDLIKRLRNCISDTVEDCVGCPYQGGYKGTYCMNGLISEAAEAIEELSKPQNTVHLCTSCKYQYPECPADTGVVFGRGKGNDNICQCADYVARIPRWIPVTERLPECDLGAEVGNIEWISCGMVHSGCFGRGGKYRDAYFRTWTDAGEGMDAKDADYWRAVTIPEPPKEERKYD